VKLKGCYEAELATKPTFKTQNDILSKGSAGLFFEKWGPEASASFSSPYIHHWI